MTIPILMPAFSATMTEGKIVRWLKREGDPVKRGEVIAEVETDKAILDIEATADGTLGKILAEQAGALVAVNQPIAILVGAGDRAGADPTAPTAKGGRE